MNIINNLLKNGISLEEIGVNNWALTKEDSFTLLNILRENNIPVIGGDVCEIIDGKINYNYDNWYCDKFYGESDSNFVIRSIDYSISYIQLYKSNNTKKIFFSFVFDII